MSRWFVPPVCTSVSRNGDRHHTGLRTREVTTMTFQIFADASLRRRITLFSFTLALLSIIMSSLWCPNEIGGTGWQQASVLAAETDALDKPAKQLKKTLPHP